MKQKLKLLSALIFVSITMATMSSAQTVTGSGNYKYLPRWNSSPNGSTLTNSLIYDNGTNVGIGTTSPGSPLEVKTGVGAFGFSHTDGTRYLTSYVDGTGGMIGTSSNDPLQLYTNNNTVLTLSTSGNANLNGSANAYQINGNNMLWHNNNTNDIFVGYLAGNATMSGHYNTFMGKSAGNAITAGTWNTAIGFEAMKSNTICMYNTAIGYQALYTQSTCPLCWDDGHATNSAINTAVGYQALYNSSAYGGCALGYNAGFANTSGCTLVAVGESAAFSNTTGNYNVTVGGSACAFNQTGSGNTVMGDNAGKGVINNSHTWNSFFGSYAGYGITTGGNNVFSGYKAGYTNTSGGGNDFTGYKSGYTNAGGGLNTAMGGYSLYSNSSSDLNTAIGYQALYSTTGGNNTGLGVNSGYGNTTGTNNTFLGYGADVNAGNKTNATAIGYGAVVSASNKVRIGDANVTVIEGTVAYTTSDGRFKTNVKEEVKGLEFIKKLRPVNYNFDSQKFDEFLIKNMPDSIKEMHTNGVDYTVSSAIIHSGFIAQEVEQAAIDCGFTTDIVHKPIDENDNYSLAYGAIVVPLVKAVQELSKTADSLQTKIKNQDSINTYLQNEINELTSSINSCCSSGIKTNNNTNSNTPNTITTNVTLNNAQTIVLEQNVPNPFAEQTTINYSLPDNTDKAQILFYNADGKLIQAVDITQKGKGQLNVFASDLSNGIYTYTLVVDGKVVETKRMVKQ